MSNGVQVMKVQLNNPFTKEDERKFWKKLHRILQNSGGWWNVKQRTVWIDFVYRPQENVDVYLSIPQKQAEKITALLTPEGRRKSILGNASHDPVDRQELLLPPKTSVCELRLAYENLFSLSTQNPVQLPITLDLEEGEKARISFCLQPTSSAWHQERSRTIREKTEKGLIRPRDGRLVGLMPMLMYLVRMVFAQWMHRQQEMEPASPWISRDTLKKWNDYHFKTVVRIAAPQRLLPKLARPFQNLKGENRLNIHFLARKENRAGLRQQNKQKLGLASMLKPNSNVFSTRELTAVVPFLTFSPAHKQAEARPNFV